MKVNFLRSGNRDRSVYVSVGLVLGGVFLLLFWRLGLMVSPPSALASTPTGTVGLAGGDLIRVSSLPAVYYFGPDAKRYVYPNEKTFFTWYADFSGVKLVSDAQMAAIPIGGNVTYRPGVRMVKLTSDPTVYVVSPGGQLRAVPSEAVAVQLYGTGWNRMIDDLPDAFFVNYRTGSALVTAADFSPAAAAAAAVTFADEQRTELPTDASASTSESSSASAAGGSTASTPPRVGACQVFPADNPWNTDISGYPIHPDSAAMVATIGSAKGLHPDFGQDPTYGIPFDLVRTGQPKVTITFDAYGDESDPGPYPIPTNAKVESGSDRHVLVLDQDACVLYELYAARKDAVGSGWTAESGAVFDLKSNALRPAGWTSADAAGLPIYPGLVKYSEVAAGAINHAIRFTAEPTRRAYIPPATHQAGSGSSTAYPPMGLRLRLKADYDIAGFSRTGQIILTAMKKFGLILADNGGDWFFQGEKGAAWNDDELNELKSVPGSAFEAVWTGAAVTD